MDELEGVGWRDPADLLALLADVERLYDLGGPSVPLGSGAEGAFEPDAWHGDALDELNKPANMDAAVFAEAAAGLGLADAAGLRALVRLSSARAVAAALRFALGMDDPRRGGGASAETAVEEITSTQWWLDQGR